MLQEGFVWEQKYLDLQQPVSSTVITDYVY